MKRVLINQSSRHVQIAVSALALVLALWAKPVLAQPTITDLATGVLGGVGIAYDPASANVYYVEFNSGFLKRIQITPGCDLASPATCPAPTIVAKEFVHPEDVALDVDKGLAYVTTRDDPSTSGALWRVNLAQNTKSVVTWNLGAPHQIVLDTPNNTAYVIGFTSGKLWKINLTNHTKVAMMTGLVKPVGLAVTADKTRAYVTEQTPAQLVEIDLALHTRIRNVVTGLTSPFYLSWTDPGAQYPALYLVQRDPANSVLRVELPSSTKIPVVTGLPFRPSGIAVNLMAGAVYVTADSKVVKVGLVAPLDMSQPVFLRVGDVASTDIKEGYATTTTTPRFTDSPFGGTLDILGNLSNFKAPPLNATHYRVKVSHAPDLSTTTTWSLPAPLALSWTAQKWQMCNGINQYCPTQVSPVPGTDVYEIPAEYPAAPHLWNPSFLMMRWPSWLSGPDNHYYKFTVELLKKKNDGTYQTLSPPPTSNFTLLNNLTVRVDNGDIEIDVVKIRQRRPGDSTTPPTADDSIPTLNVCGIITTSSTSSPPLNAQFQAKVTVYDPNGHLKDYYATPLFGHNLSLSVASDAYDPAHVNPSRLWSGEKNKWLPVGVWWEATCNCGYTVLLEASKRTINGKNYLRYFRAHQSFTVNIGGGVSPCQ